MGGHGVAFDSLNVRDGGEGERRWVEAGRPLVPSLVVGGVATPVLHRSQLAALLGLPAAEEGEAEALARDCEALLDAWLTGIRDLEPGLLAVPTPSRGRTLRNLTVNVVHPFELLPGACAGEGFPWEPERDAEREEALGDAAALLAWATGVRAAWGGFLAGAPLDPSLAVSSPRGEIALGALLAQQRWHAAFHYRQLVAFRELEGVALEQPYPVDSLPGLDLPRDVF